MTTLYKYKIILGDKTRVSKGVKVYVVDSFNLKSAILSAKEDYYLDTQTKMQEIDIISSKLIK